jgi:RNA polymerase sigma-32 factor
MAQALVANNLPIPSAIGSLDAYIGAVNRFPVLTVEDEQAFARRYRDGEDLDSARQLVLAHLRFVVHVARGYQGYGLGMADLIQEGNIGLMKAVKRFDPDQGVRLVSFAVHWIRAEMHEFILRNWRIVKVATTKAQRKLFFNLRSSKKRLGWFSQEEVEGVARDLGVKPETVLEMESRLNNHDLAYDGIDNGDDDQAPAPAAYLADMRMEPSRQLESVDSEANDKQQLYLALEGLDERSKEILEARWLAEKKMTLHELADKYGVSAERIRQIEKAAMGKLKAHLVA